MIRATIAKVAVTTAAAVLTEKFLLNVLVIMAGWAVGRWGNELAEDLFEQFKKALDNDYARDAGVAPVPKRNLYDEVRYLKPEAPAPLNKDL